MPSDPKILSHLTTSISPRIMHPDLRLSTLDALPPFLRNPALAAARGSTEDLFEIDSLAINDIPDGYSHKFLELLPVFHANIEPTRIPTAHRIKNPEAPCCAPPDGDY
ncbi:hypothetical protein C8R43DRAFT_1230362 [Mycena crocata]|nr:hypothetical protein C8R43DRAFT_1230362 [Mycena crocata]